MKDGFCRGQGTLLVAAQMTIVESLHRITTNRSVIFAAANNDTDFVSCLTHLLFMLSVKPDFGVSPDDPRLMTSLSSFPSIRLFSVVEGSSIEQQAACLREGSSLVSTAACRVWEELYLAKKQLLEETFRTALVPEINAARALVGEMASRQW